MVNNETERKDTVDNDTEKGEAAPRQKQLPMWLLAAVGVIVIVVLAVVFTLGSSPGGGGLTVLIDAPAEVSAGSDFTVRVEVGEVLNFDSANYDIGYDSDILEVTGVTNGSIGNTTIPVRNWNIYPSMVRVLNNIPMLAPVNGSGYLAEVQFHVIGSSGDTSVLEFKGNCVLYNVEAVQIPAEWDGGSVFVK